MPALPCSLWSVQSLFYSLRVAPAAHRCVHLSSPSTACTRRQSGNWMAWARPWQSWRANCQPPWMSRLCSAVSCRSPASRPEIWHRTRKGLRTRWELSEVPVLYHTLAKCLPVSRLRWRRYSCILGLRFCCDRPTPCLTASRFNCSKTSFSPCGWPLSTAASLS